MSAWCQGRCVRLAPLPARADGAASHPTTGPRAAAALAQAHDAGSREAGGVAAVVTRGSPGLGAVRPLVCRPALAPILSPTGRACRVGDPVDSEAGRHAARPMAPSAQAAAVSACTAERSRPTAADLPGAHAPRQAHHPARCRLCPHQATAPAGPTPDVWSVHQPRVVGTATPAPRSNARAHRRGPLLRHTALRRGRLSGPVVRSDRTVVCHGLPRLRGVTMALEPGPYPGTMACAGCGGAATALCTGAPPAGDSWPGGGHMERLSSGLEALSVSTNIRQQKTPESSKNVELPHLYIVERVSL